MPASQPPCHAPDRVGRDATIERRPAIVGAFATAFPSGQSRIPGASRAKLCPQATQVHPAFACQPGSLRPPSALPQTERGMELPTRVPPARPPYGLTQSDTGFPASAAGASPGRQDSRQVPNRTACRPSACRIALAAYLRQGFPGEARIPTRCDAFGFDAPHWR